MPSKALLRTGLALFLLAITSCHRETPVEGWYTLNEAFALAKESGKPIFVDIYADWCPPCKMMDRETFSHPRVQKLFKETILPVKLDAESPEGKINYRGVHYSPAQFANALQIEAYPSLVFFDSQGNLLQIEKGFKDAAAFERLVLSHAN